MSTKAQIAANRRNALKSTGPRSSAGKGRASLNSYRHGLNLSPTFTAALRKHLEKRVRSILGCCQSQTMLQHAYAMAEAELHIARVRSAKLKAIEAAAAGRWPDAFTNTIEEISSPGVPSRIEPASLMNPGFNAEERTAQAILHSIPQIVRLDRYERRATSRRDRAVRKLWRSPLEGE